MHGGRAVTRSLLRARPRALRAAPPPHPPAHQGPADLRRRRRRPRWSPSTAAASRCSSTGTPGDGDEGAAARPQGRRRRRPGARRRRHARRRRLPGPHRRGRPSAPPSLRRTADDDDPVERVIVANADQLVVVTALADPEPRPRPDRPRAGGGVRRRAWRRCSASPRPTWPTRRRCSSTYRSLGVPWVVTQLKGEGAGDLTELRDRLRGRTSVLVGHSGVGKSTLVNALVPDADREVGIVNAVTGRGRHTSTSAYLLALPRTADGWIIDTPGIRSFGLAHVAAGGPDRGVPRPRRDDRGLPARLHPRHGRAGVRARRGGRGRRGRPRPGRVVPAAARGARGAPPSGDAGGSTPRRPGRRSRRPGRRSPAGRPPLTASSTATGMPKRVSRAPLPDASAEVPPRAHAAEAGDQDVAQRDVAQHLAPPPGGPPRSAASSGATPAGPPRPRPPRAPLTATTTARTTRGQRSSQRHLGTAA